MPMRKKEFRRDARRYRLLSSHRGSDEPTRISKAVRSLMAASLFENGLFWIASRSRAIPRTAAHEKRGRASE
jgi:hypothetical protein